MKLHLSQNSRRNAITAYGQGYVAVNGVRHETSLIVMPDRIAEDWKVQNFESLVQDNIEALAALKPELVLLGTGDVLCFPDPRLLVNLTHAGIGAEVMDTRAACRTYNILAEEGRNVAAALIIPERS
ncbi:MAG: Mth938-like domain-containing protein [Betaproteobacteria bacterium]|nr:Mth938-like domain-containing protein [Betaproteobacteria bacterium]